MSNNKKDFYHLFQKLQEGINTEKVQQGLLYEYNRLVEINKNLTDEIKELNSYEYYDIKDGIIKQLTDENETLKETNKNLLEISEQYKQENDKLKERIEYLETDKEFLQAALRLEKYENEKLNRETYSIKDLNFVLVSDLNIFKEENDKLKQKVKDLDMKLLTEFLNKAMWHNTYEADIQALKGNLEYTKETNKSLKEENKKLKNRHQRIKNSMNILYGAHANTIMADLS